MDRVRVHRLTATYLPWACLLLGFGLVGGQYFRLHASTEEANRIEKNVGFYHNLLGELKNQPNVAKYASVQPTPDEEQRFLESLRAAAEGQNVTISRWAKVKAAAAQEAPKDKGGAKEDGPIELKGTVEATGAYPNVRGFVYSLLCSPRLLNLSEVKWQRKQDDRGGHLNQISFTLTRYVARSADAAPSQKGEKAL